MAKKKLTDAQARDLDETRRLLYMVLFASRTEHYELAGTLVNALRHHQGVRDPGLEERVLSLIEGSNGRKWACEQIRRAGKAD
jgi:hypothetical protein